MILKKAQAGYEKLLSRYPFQRDVEKADALIVLGGDGFMLHSLHQYLQYNIPFYGMNCGSVGFLLNELCT